MVYTETGTRCFARVCRADPFLGSPDTAAPSDTRRDVTRKITPRTTQFHLFQSIDDLVKIKHEMGPIGDEYPIGTMKA